MHARFLAVAFLLFAAAAPPALAQPANDAWANRTTIAALPFSVTEPQAGLATNAASDPDPLCRKPGSNPLVFTLWYGYTTGAQVEYVNASITGGDINGIVAIYTGSPGSFRLVSGGCGTRGNSAAFVPRAIGIRLEPNTSYSILASSQFPVPGSQPFIVNLAAAPQLVVTKTADTRDGACNADCSLREAIDAANASTSVVIVPAGTYAITRSGRNEDANATGDLDLLSSMGVYGAPNGATIVDAAGLDRAIDIKPDAAASPAFPSISLGDLVLREGDVSGPQFERDGGNLRVRGNTTFFGIDRVDATLGNTQESGGGFFIEGTGTVRRANLSENSAGLNGGGIAVVNNPNRAVIEESLLYRNLALQGAGLYVQGEVLVSNSTIAANRASILGGGVATFTGRLELASSTVVDNIAGLGGGGGGMLIAQPTLPPGDAITNSIVARNSTDAGDASPDCISQSPTPRAYSLIQSGTACGPPGTGDVTGLAPGIAATAGDQGGPTHTYALLAGSPALDAGDPAGCRDAAGALLATDQRGQGFPRVVGLRCDIGALESPPTLPPGPPSLAMASDTGLSSSDGVTNDATPTFTGACAAGTTVTVTANDVPIATAVACAAGAYAVTAAPALADGIASVKARANGVSGPSLDSTDITVRIDTQAPAAPTLVAPTVASTTSVIVSGIAGEAGRVDVTEGGAPRCSVTVDAPGAWQCTIAFAETGTHLIVSAETDVAGNVGPQSTTESVTIQENLLADGFE